MISINKISPETCQAVKVIATDFDGTLTINSLLTGNVLNCLLQLQQQGISVIIVTGRSAGWVNALRYYLPVVGAIAENGGLYDHNPETPPDFLVSLPPKHRQQLAAVFASLQLNFPNLKESTDNPFRFTDWTFDVAGLSQDELVQLEAQCEEKGYSFTYSSVQGHIKPQGQDKATGLQAVLKQYFSDVKPEEVITIGDSPNDQSLFNPQLFPISVGVANIKPYQQQLTYTPQYVTAEEEGKGFCELAQQLISMQDSF